MSIKFVLIKIDTIDIIDNYLIICGNNKTFKSKISKGKVNFEIYQDKNIIGLNSLKPDTFIKILYKNNDKIKKIILEKSWCLVEDSENTDDDDIFSHVPI